MAEPPVVVTSSTMTMRLPLQALALRQSFDREPSAMLLRLLAHEEGRDGIALQPGQLRDCARDRNGAHLQSADVVDVVILQRIERQLREQRRTFGIEHRRLEVEIEVALAAGGQRDFAASERAGADDVGKACAGGRVGQW